MYHATHRLSKERLKSVSRLRAACPLSDGMAPVCLGLVERVVDGRRRLEFGDQESSRELVRHLCEVCGGSGGRSSVWTRRERTRSNDKEVV